MTKMEMAGMDGSKGMSPRKVMAGGTEGGNFGIASFGEQHASMGKHPDHGMSHEPLMDHERGIGMPIKHSEDMHPAQAAPRHGPMHMGMHKGRYGK